MADITLQQATAIVEAALRKARETNCAPLAVAVLDAGGHLKAFAREDGAGIIRPQIATGKAWGALGMGVGSRALARRVADQPQQQSFFAALNAFSEGHRYAKEQPGGQFGERPYGDDRRCHGVPRRESLTETGRHVPVHEAHAEQHERPHRGSAGDDGEGRDGRHREHRCCRPRRAVRLDDAADDPPQVVLE